MKRFKSILLIFTICLIFSGCGVKEGYVVDKEIIIREQTDDMPMVNHSFNTYVLYVQKCNNGIANTDTWNVSKRVYESFNIDDYITLEDANK